MFTPSRYSLEEGALPTLNLPRANADATNNLSTSAIEKKKNIHI